MSLERAGRERGSERRLLIASDGPQRARLRNALRDVEDVKLIEAACSLDALERILAGEADLCIADAGDLVLGGLDLLHVALSAPGGADLPVLILASPGEGPTRCEALAAGAWDYLPKPPKPELVVERVGLALAALPKNEAAGPLPRVLFADPDPDYLRWVVRAVGEIVRVEIASTASEAAVKILRDKPALAVLAGSFRRVLQRILDARPEQLRDTCRVVAFEEDPRSPGAVPRSLDKQALAEGLRRALGMKPERRETRDANLSGLSAVLTAAVDRFFSVMTSESVELTETAAPADPAPKAWAWIDVDLRGHSGPRKLRIELECPLELRRLLTADACGSSQANADEGADCLLSEIVNVAAGRLKAFCWEQKLHVDIGLPKAGLQPPPESGSAAPHWRAAFRWKEQPFALACTIR
jgi:CheY-like chemotaxis protein